MARAWIGFPRPARGMDTISYIFALAKLVYQKKIKKKLPILECKLPWAYFPLNACGRGSKAHFFKLMQKPLQNHALYNKHFFFWSGQQKKSLYSGH